MVQVCDVLRCSAKYDTLAELTDAMERVVASPLVGVLQVECLFHESHLFTGVAQGRLTHVTACMRPHDHQRGTGDGS